MPSSHSIITTTYTILGIKSNFSVWHFSLSLSPGSFSTVLRDKPCGLKISTFSDAQIGHKLPHFPNLFSSLHLCRCVSQQSTGSFESRGCDLLIIISLTEPDPRSYTKNLVTTSAGHLYCLHSILTSLKQRMSTTRVTPDLWFYFQTLTMVTKFYYDEGQKYVTSWWLRW